MAPVFKVFNLYTVENEFITVFRIFLAPITVVVVITYLVSTHEENKLVVAVIEALSNS
jgi:hypothetical protein